MKNFNFVLLLLLTVIISVLIGETSAVFFLGVFALFFTLILVSS